MIDWFKHLASWIRRYRYSYTVEATFGYMPASAVKEMRLEVVQLRKWNPDY